MAQLDDREARRRASDRLQAEAPVDPLQRPLLERREQRRREPERVERRFRPQPAKHGPGARVQQHPVAGSQPVDRRASGRRCRPATKLASQGSPSAQPVVAAAADQDLRPEVGRRQHEAARSPGMWRASCRSPASARGSSGGGCQSRRSEPRSDSPPGAAWASASAGSARRSSTRRPRREQATASAPASAAGPRDRSPRPQQQAQPERARQQRRQADVGQDVSSASGRRSS